jgi:beta-lactamase regulating signal transducer with metallopeptidase domain
MLHEAFYWILNMSIIASVFGVLIYSLRFIKGFPKFASYILWIIVLVRLLCPIGLSSDYSLLNMISKVANKTYVKTIPIVDRELDEKEGSVLLPEFSLSNSIQGAATYNPITYKTNVLEGFFKIASILWIIIAIAAIIAMISLYHLTKSELRKAIHLRENIYEGTMVITPTVYGLVKPRIVLPVGVNKEHLEYILAHEKVHIRRHDNIWRMLAILSACIHWFNPLSWLFLKSFLGDCELACDEAAVKKMKSEDRKNYALTLLAYTSTDTTVFASAFGSSKVKVRIENVMTYKKLTLFSAICFVGMVFVMAFLLLTNAVG